LLWLVLTISTTIQDSLEVINFMSMPNFLIIGAAKSGTTALYYYLKQHPQIYMSSLKEPNFFAFEGEQLNFRDAGDREARINQKVITNIEAYRDQFRGISDQKAIGEASPWYLYSPKAPERILNYIPEAKLIAILRNPVERAYSSFLHLIRDGREPIKDFAQALIEEESRIQNNYPPLWHYKQAGYYYPQLKRYFDRFDPKQISIYLYENFQKDPIEVLQDIFQFLNVENSFVPEVSLKHNVSGIPKNQTLNMLFKQPNLIKSIFKLLFPKELRQQLHQNILTKLKNQNLVKPKLSPELHRELMQLYRDDILQLQELIQQDLSGWLDSSVSDQDPELELPS
jgi:hypothetical protein